MAEESWRTAGSHVERSSCTDSYGQLRTITDDNGQSMPVGAGGLAHCGQPRGMEPTGGKSWRVSSQSDLSDQSDPRTCNHRATNWSANTPLFLKGVGGMGEGILRCRRSAFSREKNFSPSPISQRFSNKKKTRRRQFRGETLAPPPQGCGAMSAIISDYIA